MQTEIKIGQKGSNLFISIPKQMEREMHLFKGELMKISNESGEITLKKKADTLDELLAETPKDPYRAYYNENKEFYQKQQQGGKTLDSNELTDWLGPGKQPD